MPGENLIVDACRAVGVPARVVGTPLWSNHSGNHTWAEIWDGDWHFTGAAEQDPNGLDRGWFVGNASQAVKEEREHAIYASSFKRTELTFPLSWTRGVDYVSAVNVTDRYAAKSTPPEPAGMQLAVDVYDRPVGGRVAARVTVTDASDSTVRFEGVAKAESADLNDHLSFLLPKQRTYVIETQYGAQKQRQHFTTGTNREDRLAIFLSGISSVPPPPATGCFPPPITKPFSLKDEARLKAALSAFFTAPTNQQAQWKFSGSLERLLRGNETAVRRVAWESFRAVPDRISSVQLKPLP